MDAGQPSSQVHPCVGGTKLGARCIGMYDCVCVLVWVCECGWKVCGYCDCVGVGM